MLYVVFFLLPIFISRSTLTYRALYYGKIETQTSYIYILRIFQFPYIKTHRFPLASAHFDMEGNFYYIATSIEEKFALNDFRGDSPLINLAVLETGNYR